jgi:hypothetical protein
MTKTSSKTVSEMISKTDQPSGLFDDDQSKIEALYCLWIIVLSKDYPLFAEMISALHKLSDNLDTCKQLEDEQRKLWFNMKSSHLLRNHSHKIDDISIRIEILKARCISQLDDFKTLTFRVVEVIKTHVKTTAGDSEDGVLLFTKYVTILSLAYNGNGNEELIKQALNYICSIDVELAKTVIKVHGNLTHTLENGNQCKLCQS